MLESLTISEFTNAELTNEEAQDGWTYAPITEPSTYITKCNGLDVLGGYNNFNSNLTSISKTFTKSSPQGIFLLLIIVKHLHKSYLTSILLILGIMRL